MKLILKSDKQGLDFQFSVEWKSLTAMLKALITVLAAILSFLAAPEIARLFIILGIR